MAFASELAAGILQLLIFSLVPFVWWAASARGEGSFLTYMGLKGVSTKNKWRLWLLVAMTFVAFAAASLFALHLLGNVATAVSAFAGQGASAVPAILSYAIIRTSLSEELLFRGFLLPNMPHSHRMSGVFPPQAHIRGVTSATGPARHRPARPLGASPPAGACHAASAPDTGRPRAAASCHAWRTPVHATCVPAPPWSPRPAAIPDSGAKSAPLTGCPRGFSQVTGNDHPSGAHFSGC